ncbi:MAG: DNA-deoxyinosine glycosylase [Deltaproteobacteria bacterium]|nr:DNA-deoxyinosine glycosylase [Candidatus Tharpella aukensis]
MGPNILNGLAPIEATSTQLLILGSMPGQESLNRQQYYAHPRNAFWFIMAGLLKFPPELSYPERQKALKQNRISLWDVLDNCIRPGSLDSDIVGNSEVANKLDDFHHRHLELQTIAFNGRKARLSFTRHFLRHNQTRWQNLTLIDLPSTSPAYAALRPAKKLERWHKALSPFLPIA